MKDQMEQQLITAANKKAKKNNNNNKKTSKKRILDFHANYAKIYLGRLVIIIITTSTPRGLF